MPANTRISVRMFPPSPDGGFIEGPCSGRARSLRSRFHHLQMVASLREGGRPRADGVHRAGFHHLQMVASLRAAVAGCAVTDSAGFHHLQMVASLRGSSSSHSARASRGFHHLQMVASLRVNNQRVRVDYQRTFPPSPNGGFIEGEAFLLSSCCGLARSFHHLQMVASLRACSFCANVCDRSGFHHLQMVASLRVPGPRVTQPRIALFPPSPDGGFIEGAPTPCGRRSGSRAFPPSPDGGFIEDDNVFPMGAPASNKFPPSPDGGFIEGRRVDRSGRGA